jgi:glutathione S-transferase
MSAQAPIILYGAVEGFGLPAISPYVMKTEVQLKMAGLDYERRPARPQDSPKGQVPFIGDGEEKVADSTFIRAHLEEKYGVDLDAGLSEVERAQAWAIERMLENHFSWAAIVQSRWLTPENFAKGPARFFEGAPESVREEVLDRVRTNYYSIGLGRHSELEVETLACHSLRALATILGEKPYLFGGTPCGVDATAFAMLAGIMTPFFESRLRERAEQFPTLVAYVDRMMARFYPEFGWKM